MNSLCPNDNDDDDDDEDYHELYNTVTNCTWYANVVTTVFCIYIYIAIQSLYTELAHTTHERGERERGRKGEAIEEVNRLYLIIHIITLDYNNNKHTIICRYM